MYGRRPRCKRNLTFPRGVRVQPCIRPLSAAAMAAGPDVIDRVPTKSARSFLAWHFTGFPDRRSRPHRINVVITPAVHERTDVNLILPLASPFSRCREPRHPIALTLGQ